MNQKLKKYILVTISTVVFFAVYALYLKLTKHINHNLRTILDPPVMILSIFIAVIGHKWLIDKNSIHGNSFVFWKYWLIGITFYILFMIMIENHPKESLLEAIGFVAAGLMGWFGYRVYYHHMVDRDLSYCKDKAMYETHLSNSYNYSIRTLTSVNYAQASLSKKYLYSKDIKKDDKESLYWAKEAYKHSDAYIDGYTVIRSKDISR